MVYVFRYQYISHINIWGERSVQYFNPLPWSVHYPNDGKVCIVTTCSSKQHYSTSWNCTCMQSSLLLYSWHSLLYGVVFSLEVHVHLLPPYMLVLSQQNIENVFWYDFTAPCRGYTLCWCSCVIKVNILRVVILCQTVTVLQQVQCYPMATYPSMILYMGVCLFMYNVCVFVLPLTSVDPRYIAP